MFDRLMIKRSLPRYRKSYFNILCIFTLSVTMFAFMNIFASSTLYWTDAVLVPFLTKDYTCDFRIINADEEQTAYFQDVSGVRAEYINGSIDFFLTDPERADAVWDELQRIHHDTVRKDYLASGKTGNIEDYPSIYSYVGLTGKEGITDYVDHIEDISRLILLFQAVLSVPGLAAMVMIYRDYIAERTPDIRTLIGLGIGQKRLRRLFFGECSVLYGVSAALGFGLGAGLAALLFSGTKGIDFLASTTEYPVFHIDPLSLLLTLCLSWLVVWITFELMMRRVSKIDASYTCMEAVSAFREKDRAYYRMANGRFIHFFSVVLGKRGSRLGMVQIALESYAVAVAVFALNAVNYLLTESIRLDGFSRTVVVQAIANNSVFLMLGFFAALYSMVVVWIFTKRHAEACAEPVQILYALGAEEKNVFACFRRLAIRKQTIALVSGLAAGYGVTVLIFQLAGYAFSINLPFILAHFLLIGIFAAAAWISAKTSYGEICRSNLELLAKED